jgi:hypothetical protein
MSRQVEGRAFRHNPQMFFYDSYLAARLKVANKSFFLEFVAFIVDKFGGKKYGLVLMQKQFINCRFK